MKGAILVVVAVLSVAVMVVVMARGVEVHNQEQALSAYRSYLMEARQLADAGQEPSPPGKVPLPKGYALTLNGDLAILTKDGTVVKEERYRRLALRSGFDEPHHPPPWTLGFTSGDIDWTLVTSSAPADECGDSGVINGSDYLGTGSNPCIPYEGTGMAYLRGMPTTLTSEPLNLSGLTSATLSFWWWGGSYESGTEKAVAEVWDGSAWRELACIEDETLPDIGCGMVDNMTRYHERIDVTPYLNSNFQVRFELGTGPLDYLFVDSVSITGGW